MELSGDVRFKRFQHGRHIRVDVICGGGDQFGNYAVDVTAIGFDEFGYG